MYIYIEREKENLFGVSRTPDGCITHPCVCVPKYVLHCSRCSLSDDSWLAWIIFSWALLVVHDIFRHLGCLFDVFPCCYCRPEVFNNSETGSFCPERLQQLCLWWKHIYTYTYIYTYIYIYIYIYACIYIFIYAYIYIY